MTQLRQFNNDEFHPNTFVIDPAGCGCTDCMMGYSSPADQVDVHALFQAMTLGFTLEDRRNQHEKGDARSIFASTFPVDPAWVRFLISMIPELSQE